MRKRYKRLIGSRLLVTVIAVLIQIAWLFSLLRFLAPYALLINMVLTIMAVFFVIYVSANQEEPAYKSLWLITILAFPLFGGILYLCFGNHRTSYPLKKRLDRTRMMMGLKPEQTPHTLQKLEQEDKRVAQIFQYLRKQSGYPVCAVEQAEFYPLGEDLFATMLRDLRGARRYIFVESFIIEEGCMWNNILQILSTKASQGVDVRVIYDDVGSLTTLPPDYNMRLKAKGISCIAFNPMRPILSGTLNNRDHRKIMVIDESIAYSGGVNLADEYINAVEKYGHWKDIGFRVTGPAAQNFADMFVEFWNAFAAKPIPRPEHREEILPGRGNGFVLPYYDDPTDRKAISNHLYIELLGQAKHYAWFYTPYLMLGDTLLDAFTRAVQRGVDVRIYLPGIPDKQLIYRISHSYYEPLLKAGVRIFEYIPGFLHAKACLVDDELGVIGSVNLDFRSLFLHFECNALFYRANLLKPLREDFLQTQEFCREIAVGDRPFGLHHQITDSLLRVIAPLC